MHLRAQVAQADHPRRPPQGRGWAAPLLPRHGAGVGPDPDFADAHYNLGLLCEALGKRSEAIRHLRKARALYGRSGSGR
ncbi:MAG: tetratricopeptide repeat protein [Candidatus Methylomirabilales bacterium]